MAKTAAVEPGGTGFGEFRAREPALRGAGGGGGHAEGG